MSERILADSVSIIDGLDASSRVVALTGAGISAESGIPTFRGRDGYWTAGSVNYRPEELATRSAFARMPDEVWSWYLYRRACYAGAEPNTAHRALVKLEHALGDRFRLVTQNVDGLQRRAGSAERLTYEVHGNIHFARCLGDCGAAVWPLPDSLGFDWSRERRITTDELGLLACTRCGGMGRPHVLWFDEYYDEERFHFESSLRAVAQAQLLVVIGTTGMTGLPQHAAHLAARAGASLVTIDPESNPFGYLFARSAFLKSTAGSAVPPLVERLVACAGS